MKSSRLLSLLLAVCLLFSLSSCSERGNTGQQDPTPAETESSAVDNAAPQEDTATDAPAGQQSAGEPESTEQQPDPADAPYQADDKLVREAVLNFVIMAFAVFCIVKAFNRLHRKKEETPAPAPKPSQEELLLAEIRDLLKEGK